jgi:hypothetical protein
MGSDFQNPSGGVDVGSEASTILELVYYFKLEAGSTRAYFSQDM